MLKKWIVMAMMAAAPWLMHAHPGAGNGIFAAEVSVQAPVADTPGQSEYWEGLCRFHGYGVNQNFAKAVKKWKKATVKGHVKAMFSLGYCYANGVGVAQDDGKAKEWYAKAAEHGDADAMYNLGLLYMQDRIKDAPDGQYVAGELFRDAAQKGHARAANNLAYCLAWGIGVPAMAEEALKWLYVAAEQGHWKAKEVIREYEEEGPAYVRPKRIRR